MKTLNYKPVFILFLMTTYFMMSSARAGGLYDSIPKGWRGGIQNGADIVLGTDQQVKHSGKSSGFIQRIPTPIDANGAMMQSNVANPYRNKRVRFSVYIKSSEVQSAYIFFTVQSPDSAIAYANNKESAIHENTEWTLCQLTLDIPENSRNMDFGVILNGQGKVWIDDGKLEIVDHSVPSDDRIAKGLTNKLKLPQQNNRLNAVAMNLGFEE